MSTTYGATGLGQTAVSTRRVSSFFKRYWGAFQERRKRQRLRATLYDLRTAATIIESAPCGKLTRLGGIPGWVLGHYARRHDRQAIDSATVGSGRLEAR
jgi:hypothetical protein